MRYHRIKTEDLLLAAKVREIAFLHQQKARSIAFNSWLDDTERNTSGNSSKTDTKTEFEGHARIKVLTPEKRIDFLTAWDAANPVEHFAKSAIDELMSYAQVIMNNNIRN